MGSSASFHAKTTNLFWHATSLAMQPELLPAVFKDASPGRMRDGNPKEFFDGWIC